MPNLKHLMRVPPTLDTTLFKPSSNSSAVVDLRLMFPYVLYKWCNSTPDPIYSIYSLNADCLAPQWCFVSPHRPKLTTPASLELDTHKPSGQVSSFIHSFCTNSPQHSIVMTTWYIMWPSPSLQEWRSPSQVSSTGRTWTAADTKSAWVSSWRHKDSAGGRTRKRGKKATQEERKKEWKHCKGALSDTETHTVWTQIHTFVGLISETTNPPPRPPVL